MWLMAKSVLLRILRRFAVHEIGARLQAVVLQREQVRLAVRGGEFAGPVFAGAHFGGFLSAELRANNGPGGSAFLLRALLS